MTDNDPEKTIEQSWIERGLAHEANSEFKLAVASFSEAISNSPESPIAWKLRGTAYYRLNEFNQAVSDRSEEHTSELQSLVNLVCRLLLEKKKEK